MVQPDSIEDRIDEGDKEAYALGPVSASYNEVHAMELGLVGVFGGLLYASGYVELGLITSLVLILTALGIKQIHNDKLPMAIKTYRHEPWWFMISYTACFLFGTIFHTVFIYIRTSFL